MKVLDTVIIGIRKLQVIFKMLEDTLKWHWKIIILLAFCSFIYWAFTLPPVEVTESEPEEYREEYIDTNFYKDGTN